MLNISQFKEVTELFTKILSNDEICIEEIKKLTNENLATLKTKYNYDREDKFKPVNFLRYEVICKLLENKELVTKSYIEELKSKIINHDLHIEVRTKFNLAAFTDSNQTKDYFKSYNQFGKIFYSYFLNLKKSEINHFLDSFAKDIQNQLNIKDESSISVFDFNGPRKTGDSSCWIAIYPNFFKTHRNSVQLFARFYENKIDFGLYLGSERENHNSSVFEKKSISYSATSLNEIISYFNSVLSQWRAENQLLRNTNSKRFWKCGFGGLSMRETFINNNEWFVQYERDDADPAAIDAYERLDQVAIGDEIVIAGYGGQNDLIVYYVGEVREITDDKLRLTKLERPLFHGKAPTGGGINYRVTISEVTRPEDIQIIFHNNTPMV